MLTPETINKLLSLSVPNKVEFMSREYYDKPLTLMVPPETPPVELTTLQGVVHLIEADYDDLKPDDLLVQVVDFNQVLLVAKKTDPWGRLRQIASAEFPAKVNPFSFGTWHSTENFIIAAQAGFQRVKIESQTEDGAFAKDLDYVLKMAGSISAGSIRNEQDDGITQNVAIKTGVTLKGEASLRPHVNLAPYRTFAEIDQVVSTFVFRAKQHNENDILLALFEADGGRWRLAAVQAIAAWLRAKLPAAIAIVA